jgi:hypothetical protein
MTPSAQVVADATIAAVHRRDHRHVGEAACHPHCVEEVYLGARLSAVCHDCGWTSAWSEPARAHAAVAEHLRLTA